MFKETITISDSADQDQTASYLQSNLDPKNVL